MEELKQNFARACEHCRKVLEYEKRIDDTAASLALLETERGKEREAVCGTTLSSVIKVIPWAICLPIAGLTVTFGLYLICVAGMFGMEDASAAEAIGTSLVTLVILFGGVGISALLEIVPWIWWFTVSRKRRKEKIEKFDTDWESANGPEKERLVNEIEALKGERSEYIDSTSGDFEFLPAGYRDPVAVTYMAKLVRDDRAADLKEALSVYDEQAHRWKLEGALKTPKARREYVIKTLNELKNHP